MLICIKFKIAEEIKQLTGKNRAPHTPQKKRVEITEFTSQTVQAGMHKEKKISADLGPVLSFKLFTFSGCVVFLILT